MKRTHFPLPFLLLLFLTAAGLCVKLAFAQVAAADPSQRVLLLRTGRILKGQIREISTGWLVSQPNGRVVIPSDQVRFEADSLEDVYLRLRIEMQNPTAASHLRLADWCFSQKLYPEATRELRDALRLDSANETARVMLHRIEQEIRRQTQPVEEASAESASSVGVLRIGGQRTGDAVPEARSLSGLSRETADAFVTRLQPLLANKCGSARCHGTVAKNDFQLEPVPRRSGNLRLRVERNLAASLKFVDPDMPLGSRLLMAIDRTHGGQLVFSGADGAEQAAVLREWVVTAAAELRARSGSRLRSTSIMATGEPQLLSPARDVGVSSAGAEVGSGGLAPEGELPVSGGSRVVGGSTVSAAGSERLDDQPKLTRFQKLLLEVEDAADEVDVFDPGEFNRRYAATPSN
jgi:hypothetical protein